MRSHMKCHLNVRPFSCSICNRTFRRRSHVISHLEVHFKSKLHTCIECAQQFDAIDLFLGHLIQQHQVYDRELLQQIKSKNVLDLSRFNIDYEKLNQSSQLATLNGSLNRSGAHFNSSGSGLAPNDNGSEYYDMTEEDYIEDEDNYDELDGDMGEDDDLDSNGQDSNEFMQSTGGKEMGFSDPPNSQPLSRVNFEKSGNESMFYDSEENLDMVTPSLGVDDSELEIDFTD